MDARNVPIAPTAYAPHHKPEWFVLADLERPPAELRGEIVAARVVAVARTPATALPMDDRVLAEGPPASGWRAIRARGAADHGDPSEIPVSMGDVFMANSSPPPPPARRRRAARFAPSTASSRRARTTRRR